MKEKRRDVGLPRASRGPLAASLVVLLLGVVLVLLPAPEASKGYIHYLEVKSTINPVVSEYIEKGVKEAASAGAACVVLQLDTPGGLDTAMRDICQSILNSPVPVIVYVAPSGARAASAGVLITISAHVAAMAPGTNIGAAHPVGLGGGKMDETMLKKVENDAAAYAKSLAEQRGRNVEWAVKAVRESESVSAQKAEELNIIDLVASSLPELLEKVEGKEVETVWGKKTLALKDLPVQKFEMGWRYRLLDTLSNPNIAYILMMLGFYGLFFELSNPGVIFPGVFGAICLILAFFALQTLPVNYAGVLLILLAIILFIAEIKVVSYGVLSLGGVVALLLGSLMLIESPDPALRVSWYVILPMVATTAAFFLFAVSFALRAQLRQPTTGQEGLIGKRARVVSPIKPEGKVFVHGEYWNAESDDEVEMGETVEIVSVSELTLRVKRVSK
jgi:membrane-bound serine protease (ClpP class)